MGNIGIIQNRPKNHGFGIILLVFFEKFREGMRFKWKMDENGDKPLDGMEDHILQQTHC